MKSLHMLSVATLLVALNACTTMGTGTGASPMGNIRASLTWQSTNDRSGNMTATLNSGETYSGRYFQVTQDTRIDTLGPLWPGWGRPFARWPYWGYEPGPQFITYYSGRVLANLEGSNSTHMRCSFQLIRPSSGMSGGGEGQCQLPNGDMIDASLEPS